MFPYVCKEGDVIGLATCYKEVLADPWVWRPIYEVRTSC